MQGLPRKHLLYDPSFEHDACGVGFVASIRGERSHAILRMATEALVRLTHRGAIGGDARTGDGAGVTAQIPYRLLRRDLAARGIVPPADEDLGLGMLFLPRDTVAAERSRAIVGQVLARYAMPVLAWRDVPVDPAALAGTAADTRPRIQQVVFARGEQVPPEAFGRMLYLVRRRIEGLAEKEELEGFYIPSFSHRTVVYKGMLVAPQLAAFYHDLADPEFETALALLHQRYSTNTFPSWKLAQPFRMLAHNGEINTLQGNINWMRARQPELASTVWGPDVEFLKPVIAPGGSDSAMLDNVLELLVASGRDVRHALIMLVPEAWENMPNMDPERRAFYEYHACLSEPWDGPAALAFTDGVVVGAALDRNGLRPARYSVTDDGIVVMASEAGVLPLDEARVVEKGRLGPGQMIAVDTEAGVLQRNDAIKRRVAQQQPYGSWLDNQLIHLDDYLRAVKRRPQAGSDADIAVLRACGFTYEELQLVMRPMVLEKKEPVGSMGNDTPLTVLSAKPHVFTSYFKQRFAQVTNPPIDPLREELVMSSLSYVGRRCSFLEESESHARLIRLSSPVLLDNELASLREFPSPEFASATLSLLWPVGEGEAGMERAVQRLREEAAGAVDGGSSILILSDRGIDADHAAVPALLATGAVHHHLIREGKRMRASIVVETATAWDVHHLALLIGYGASAVNPYLAAQVVRGMVDDEEAGGLDLAHALANYRGYAVKGLLKVMSKMGISALSSYQGAQIFEAVGLARQVVDECFSGTPSVAGGAGYAGIAHDVLERHRSAFAPGEAAGRARLDDYGYYRFRKEGEYHAFNPEMVRALHGAVKSDAPDSFRRYAELARGRELSYRDLLRFRAAAPAPLDEVEPAAAIMQRFTTGAMSLGALSPEAHRVIAEAMNRIGGKSDTGEGGEEPWRFRPVNGVSYNSRIKQVASGRFGVTPDYLIHADELEIKIAQGSKPGEGGQLPGHKVVEHIAAIRHTQPGVSLISPPPHHDIYSIEDLAQLIYDLKIVNPRARVCVKLVSEAGVGTIAAGVAKGYADTIHISGHEGGTGASPLSSIKHAGTPWELGLAETQQVLVMNNLRDRVTLRTDGGIRTGRDVVVAALLGAEEYGFGTAALVAIGCQMARQCHLNTCPVGIASQRDDLRARFHGTADDLVRFLGYIAEEVRGILASLGARSLDEIIGRVDLLEQAPPATPARALELDLGSLLTPVDPTWSRPQRRLRPRNDREDEPLDDRLLRDAAPALEGRAHLKLAYPIANANRTVGARLAGEIARRYTDRGLPETSSIQCTFTGSAGQSFGAFGIKGLYFTLIGEANDYVGKGLHGGEIVIRPPADARFPWHLNTIAGNTVLYGATAGRLYAAGRVGERFCVRNSGAVAVVEGVGDHGCEYMTGGVAVVLGETGRNFGAGMSGGIAFVLDESNEFPHRYNPELVGLDRVTDSDEQRGLRQIIARHYEKTGSARAALVLDAWEEWLPRFWKVVPHPSEATKRLPAMLTEDGELPLPHLTAPVPVGIQV